MAGAAAREVLQPDPEPGRGRRVGEGRGPNPSRGRPQGRPRWGQRPRNTHSRQGQGWGQARHWPQPEVGPKARARARPGPGPKQGQGKSWGPGGAGDRVNTQVGRHQPGPGQGGFLGGKFFVLVKEPGLGLVALCPQPLSVTLQPPSVTLQPPSVTLHLPSVTLQQPLVAPSVPSVGAVQILPTNGHTKLFLNKTNPLGQGHSGQVAGPKPDQGQDTSPSHSPGSIQPGDGARAWAGAQAKTNGQG